MDDFDRLLQDALKPLQSIGKKQEKTPFKATYFEDSHTDAIIRRDWCFITPKAIAKPVTTNIGKEVKTCFSALTNEECETLTHFSDYIDKLKTRIDTEITPSHLLVYAKLIAILDLVFENNVEAYGYYYTPSDKTKFLLSDHFLFEYLHVLLRIVSYYTQSNRPIELAIDALREILALCTQALDGEGDKTSKIRYNASPNSINNTGIQTIPERYITPCDFIRVFLGGLDDIQARIHLLEAKRHESLLQETEDVNLMAIIQQEYALAHQKAKQDTKLWHYTRFMSHFWFCRYHFIVASRESALFLDALSESMESEEDRETARTTLARLLYVLERVREMEATGTDTLHALEQSLLTEYNALVKELSLITMTIDTEIYTKRRLKERTGLSFDIPIPTLILPTTTLKDVRQAAFKKYLVAHPMMDKAITIIRRIYDTRRHPDSIIVSNSNTVTTSPPLESASHLDNSARFAVLEERARWLKWITSCFILSDSTFAISSDTYPRFIEALREVEETQKEYVK